MLMVTRLKFPIAPLVSQMLDQLPADVWTRSDTTFLDPAMGGGQFLVEIQRRLRAAGHSDENISARAYGCESNILRVNYAKNNKKLIFNNLFISDGLNHNWGDMKFDVVVGNPPYQLTNSKKLWPDFINLAFKMVKPGGVVQMVVPTSWLDSNSSSLKSIRDRLTSEFDLQFVDRRARQYFDVGQDILAFGATAQPYQGNTSYICSNSTVTIDLRNGLPKTDSEQKIENVINKIIGIESKIQWIINDKAGRITSDDLHPTKTKEYCYPVWQSTANFGYVKKEPVDYGKLKLAVNYSSAFYSASNDHGNMPITKDGIGSLMGYVLVKNRKQAENLRSYLQTKAVRFLVANYKKKNTGFSDAVKRSVIPAPSKDVRWTDQDVYAFFDLTQEEIDLIEGITN